MLLLAWLGVAGVLAGGMLLHRWNVMSYPDSLWLYTSFGVAAVAYAVGTFARSSADVDAWGAQALLVPLGMFAAEAVLGPDCPQGGSCAAVGARGSLGLVSSVVVIVVFAAIAWLIARAAYRRARDLRPATGRTRTRAFVFGTIGSMLLVGLPIAAVLTGIDMLTRTTPATARAAATYVEDHCLSLGAESKMAVRAAPEGLMSSWTTFAVRRADESRPGINGKKLPSRWATLDGVHPYEAVISYNNGEVASLTCHKVDPGSGNAVAEDLVPNEPSSNLLDPANLGSQFRPLFYTQGPQEQDVVDARTPKAKPASKPSK